MYLGKSFLFTKIFNAIIARKRNIINSFVVLSVLIISPQLAIISFNADILSFISYPKLIFAFLFVPEICITNIFIDSHEFTLVFGFL